MSLNQKILMNLNFLKETMRMEEEEYILFLIIYIRKTCKKKYLNKQSLNNKFYYKL